MAIDNLGLVDERPLIRGHFNRQRPIPLPLLGGGAVRLTEILLAVLGNPGSVALIDEIEDGLYWHSLEGAWQAIDRASREAGVQIFATTHGYECIQAAATAFAGHDPGDFRLFRLEAGEAGHRVVDYDLETARNAIDLNLEVR